VSRSKQPQPPPPPAPVAQPPLRPKPGRTALILLLDIAAPIVLFYVLRGFGLSNLPALLLSAVLPGLSTVIQVVRSRHFDSLAAMMTGATVLTALSALISGNPRFLLAKDGWITGIYGIWLLATTRSNPPVVMMFARPLLEGRIGPDGESWDYLWKHLPGFRRVWRTASVIWGVATILDGVVRFVMAYSLPVNVVPALNGAQYAVLFVLLQVVTNVYYFRAGMYDPRSELYAPIRSADSDPHVSERVDRA